MVQNGPKKQPTNRKPQVQADPVKDALKRAGSQLDLSELVKDQYSLRDLARICDLAEAWVRTQLANGKIAGTKVMHGKKEVWTVAKTEVERIRQEQVRKIMDRAERKETGKKYQYRRPTEWAKHLMVKAIRSDAKLSVEQKKLFLDAINRYEVAWNKAYKERLAKKEANKANTTKTK
jgi:hypothetical protein